MALTHLVLALLVGKITGTVVEQTTDAPMLLVTVTVDPVGRVEFTDATGAYEIDGLPPGEYTVTFRYGDAVVRREHVVVGAGQTAIADARLPPTPEVITIRRNCGTVIDSADDGWNARD